MSKGHATTNLDAAEDLAPKFGMGEMGEARFVRDTLGAERIGLSHYRMNPGRRVGFGHRHGESEEVYVVLSGYGRFKVDDDVFDVAREGRRLRPPTSMREWEAGPEGLELIAFGGHAENDAEMQPRWWRTD